MTTSRLLLLCGIFISTSHLPAQVQQLPPGTSVPTDDRSASVPSSTAAALQAAEAKMAAQDWAGAVTLLQPLTSQPRPSADALYDLGFCEESMNNTPAAIKAYQHAAEADGTAVLPRVALGLLYARSGNLAAAEPALREAVSLKQNNAASAAAQAQAYRALARIHLATSPERSRDELLEGLRLSPEMPADVQLSGEIADALHDDAAAETAFARVLKNDPDEPSAAAQYARVLEHEGKPAEAHAAITKALQAHPQDPELLSEQAGMLLHEKNFPAAIPLLETLHRTHPTDTAATRLLARAYAAQGEPAKAEHLFQQLAAADPGNGDLLSQWADSLIRQKRSAEAEPLLERALTGTFSSTAERAHAAEELAFAASTVHKPETVLRAISIRNAILPMDATSAFLLATAHDTLHHSREAAGLYRQFLELANGKFPDEEWQAQQRLTTLSRAK